ncbi:MAG: hypothetical protein HKN36_13815 [Hellea sp.]|nr:hypothetical protein [Hellea sp.]
MASSAKTAVLGVRLVFLAFIALACFFAMKAIMIWMNPSSEWIAPNAQATMAVQQNQPQSGETFDFSFDPFFREAAKAQPAPEKNPDEDAPDTTLNLTLKGFIAPERAIIEGADRKQTSYGVGEEVVNGVTIQGVYPEGEYVILNRSGNRERLSIDRNSEMSALTGRPATGFSAGTGVNNPMQMLNALQFEPVQNGNRLVGYRIQSSGGLDLRTLGFRPGDVITKIGSDDLTKPGVNVKQAIIQAAMSGNSTAQITRRGRKMTIRVKVP